MNKLKRIAAEQDKRLEEIIPPLVNKYGVVGTAEQLGLSPSTISDWLKFNAFKRRTIWEREGEPA